MAEVGHRDRDSQAGLKESSLVQPRTIVKMMRFVRMVLIVFIKSSLSRYAAVKQLCWMYAESFARAYFCNISVFTGNVGEKIAYMLYVSYMPYD